MIVTTFLIWAMLIIGVCRVCYLCLSKFKKYRVSNNSICKKRSRSRSVRTTLPWGCNTVASYHPSCQRNGHLVSIASRTSGKQMQKVDFLHISARLQKITNQEITLPSICYLGRELSIYCILRTSRPFCPQASKVTVIHHVVEQLAKIALLTSSLGEWTDYGFGARPKIFAPLLGKGIFTQEGPAWKHSRELLRKQFIRVQYQNLDHFHEHVDNLINRLPSSGVVDLQPLFFDLALDTATALLFGRSVYSLRAGIDQHKENKLFAESFNIAQEGLAKRFRIAPWHFLYNPPAFRKACANVHRFVERYIQDLDLENSERRVVKKEGFIRQIAEESASLEELRDQLLNVLLAGRDTTACCLSWTLYVLGPEFPSNSVLTPFFWQSVDFLFVM